ncbi:hypothetical protein LIER_15579 [Lithospermum erythrorhizon]|uniref:Uncharacterized protein n=1 Tax=Lithospermum erythrorhizon TaxID=34254 RepID=A0AAV3Q4G4_LITER
MSGGSNPEIPSISNQHKTAPQWPDSPVMVMEPDTLAFFRLYTAVGAGFTIGYLRFSKDHDPFANIAIPQDVAQEVVSRLNNEGVGGNLPDADVISAEPLSVHLLSSSTTKSSHSRTTPSFETAEPLQAGTNARKPGNIPTIIRDSLPLEFSYEDLVNFRRYFSIPAFVEMCLPLEREQIFEPLVDPSHNEGPLARG